MQVSSIALVELGRAHFIHMLQSRGPLHKNKLVERSAHLVINARIAEPELPLRNEG